jgi:hypothetical protein
MANKSVGSIKVVEKYNTDTGEHIIELGEHTISMGFLSVDEVIEKFKNELTEEQIKKLTDGK